VSAYYNEIDPYCAEWLRNLIREGLIAPGDVDDRSIVDVKPDDLRGYTQCHFFAGLGGWSYALRLAMYPDDRPVWTGSCPCQPFSAAGKGKASGDERHLWPEWFRLIRAVRPSIIFGEQVEAAVGWGWLDLVQSDLEEEGYTVGAAVLPACSVGAPHIRQRLWFVADTECGTSERWRHDLAAEAQGTQGEARQRQRLRDGAGSSSATSELADANPSRCREGRSGKASNGRDTPRFEPTGFHADGGMGNANEQGSQARNGTSLSGGPGTTIEPRSSNVWSDLIWLPCTDRKQRPTQSGIFPLAHGVPGRVAKLRAAGNAIVPQVAAEFIKASMG
jgi:DNA (cytosine-5)-methyltransferase 1